MLESLITMGLLVVLANLVLTGISSSRAQIARQNQQIEALNVGIMAYDSDQTSLSLNGVTVHVTKSAEKVVIVSEGEEVMGLELLQKTP